MAKPIQRHKRLSVLSPAHPVREVWIGIGLAVTSIVMTLVALLTRRGSDSSHRPQEQKTANAITTTAGGESIWSVLGAVLSALSAATLLYHLWQQRREREIAPTTTEEDVEEIEPAPVGVPSPSLTVRSTPSSATMTPALSNLAIRAPTQPVANRLSSAFTALSKQPGSATAVVVAISLGLLGLTHYILSLVIWFKGDLAFLEPLQPLACIWPAFCDLRFPPYGLIALIAALIAAILFGAWLARLRPPAFIAELSCKSPAVPSIRKFAQPPYLWFTLVFVGSQSYIVAQAYRDQPIHPAVWVIGLAAALLLAWRADQGFVSVHARDLLRSPTLWNLLHLTSILTLLMTIAAITVERYWLAGLVGLLTLLFLGATLWREWPIRDWAARLERVSLLAATAISFLLFSYGLNSWNWSFLGDEYSFYDLAQQFAQGTMTDAPLSGAGVYGYHPVLSSVWQGATMWLFGETGYGWRVSHSLLLAMSLPLFYYFLRPLIGRGGSFAAVALYGCAHVLLSFGKLGSNNVQVIWVMAASLAAFMWAARRGSLGGFVLTGILIGLGFYTFAVARVYSLIVAIWLTLYYFPFDLRLRRLNRAHFAVWLAVVGAALLTALPVLSTRSAWAGQFEQTLFTSEYATAPYDRFLLLLRNTFYGLAAFLYYGQNAVFVAGAHADPITGSLMVLGIAALVATWQQGWRVRAALIASYALFVVIVTGTQQYNFPNITRTFAIAPFYALFAGVGFVALRAAFLSGTEGPLHRRVNALLKINAVLIVAVIVPLNVWLSVDFSQKYSEQKMPAFLLQTAQMSGDEAGRGPKLFYVGHPKYQYWLKTIYSVHGIPLDRVAFVFPHDALTSSNPICRAANEPAIVMIPAELDNADYIAAQLQQCWPDANSKLVKDAWGMPNLYRLINRAAAPYLHPVPGYWIEEPPPQAQLTAPPEAREAWTVYHPRGMAVSADGRVAVVEEVTQSILLFDPNGQITNVLSGVFVYPSDVGFAPDGSLIVADANEGLLWFDTEGHIRQRIQGVSSPRGLFVAPDGTIYVADTGSGRILVLNSAGDKLREISGGDRFPQPTSVTVAPDGRLAVGDPVLGRVYIIDSSGRIQAEYPIGSGDTSDDKPGLAFLPDGGFVFTNPTAGHMVWLDSSGQLVKEWSDLKRPNDLALSPDGHLLVQEGSADLITFIELITP